MNPNSRYITQNKDKLTTNTGHGFNREKTSLKERIKQFGYLHQMSYLKHK